MSDKPTVEVAELPMCFVTPLDTGTGVMAASFGTHHGIGRVVYSPERASIQIESVHGRQEFSLAATLALESALKVILTYAEEEIEHAAAMAVLEAAAQFQAGADALPEQATAEPKRSNMGGLE